MQSMQAHLQYLLGDLSKQQQARGTCPTEEAFLGKQETKGWKHHLESLSGAEGAKPQLKPVRGSRALSIASSPTQDTRVSCPYSNATAKAVSLFHSFRLFQLFLTQFCSEVFFGLLSLQHASFFIQPPSGMIHFLHESQSGGVRNREIRYHNSI